MFTSLLEAKILGEGYRKPYNERLPHSSLGYRILVAFAVSVERADMDTAFMKDLRLGTTTLHSGWDRHRGRSWSLCLLRHLEVLQVNLRSLLL